MVGANEWIQALDGQIDAVTQETAALERLYRGVLGDAARVEHELGGAWEHLAATLVPALDKPSLDRAAALCRTPQLRGDIVIQKLHDTIVNHQNRLKKALADPAYIDREAIANEVHIRLAELNDAIAPLERSTRDLEYEKYFTELLEYRYGTEEYAVRFWQMSYYTHWKHADLIVEKHGPRLKQADFKGIAAKYVDEKQALSSLEAARQSQKEKQKVVDDATALVAQLNDQIENAEPRALASVRARLREHLEPLDEKDVAALFAADADVELAWKRIVGLKKKHEYLTALAQQQLRPPIGELGNLRLKLFNERQKMNRPKNRGRSFSQADYQRRFGNDRSGKWQKRRQRIQEARTHIVEYHHYDRWSPASDLLWWDLMTDGRLDGNFIDEVRERPQPYVHHAHHDAGSSDVDAGHDFADVS